MNLDTRQRCTNLLGLDHSNRFAVGVQQVVCFTVAFCKRHLSNSNPDACGQVGSREVLYNPASGFESAIDLYSRSSFG
ncbi:MAG: hypothetical protein K2Y26_19355 [Gemmatimonadaceae bacterium]|nr:hypothetical protein [Gemmatimonadaceae bacterium]